MNPITVHSDHLAAALKHGVASARSTLPILQHVRLRTADGELRVETTDCEVWVEARVPLDAGEQFDLLLNDELLRPVATPGAGPLTIREDGRITSGRGRYAVPAMPADDFPAGDDTDWQPVPVDTQALHDAIRGVGYTGEDQSISVIFRSVHVSPGRVWCTDGRQIGTVAMDYDGPLLAIPVGQVRRVLDALQQEGATVFVGNLQGEGAGLLRISGPALQVSLRLGAPAADTMTRYIRGVEEGAARLVLRRDELLQALRRFLPFVTFAAGQTRKQALPIVRLAYDGAGLSLRDKTEEFNEQLAGADLGRAGDEAWTIAFDPKRVIAALSVIDAESIDVFPLAVNGANKLIAITPQGRSLDQVAHLLALIKE